ncbi:rabhypothetical protein [Limosa lapponica baueri]|uniref:Rab-like protein 3 n=1 Tax=Limosa lapponica baueri TaxID=1758121 RepID=A0A2I0TQL7_LIMLA|nr:rabhypothetical protein [Limosa lapponica baueri]
MRGAASRSHPARCRKIFACSPLVPKPGAGEPIVDSGLLGGCSRIILVHDLTNKKSSQNLYRWSLEALNRDIAPTGVLVTNGDRGADGSPVPTYMTSASFRIVFVSLISDYDREQFADNQIPLLVIGTKLDQIPETKRNEVLTRTAFLAEDFNAEEINLDCTNPRYLAAGSSNAVKLSRFFDKIPGFSERKRFGGGMLKSLHYD